MKIEENFIGQKKNEIYLNESAKIKAKIKALKNKSCHRFLAGGHAKTDTIHVFNNFLRWFLMGFSFMSSQWKNMNMKKLDTLFQKSFMKDIFQIQLTLPRPVPRVKQLLFLILIVISCTGSRINCISVPCRDGKPDFPFFSGFSGFFLFFFQMIERFKNIFFFFNF